MSKERATARLVEGVRFAGQSIIDNAESIVGKYDYQTDIDIHISIPMNGEPEITASTSFIPEGVIENADPNRTLYVDNGNT